MVNIYTQQNFCTDLHLACGTDDLRPAMAYISFNKGRAIATNAHIVAVQCLKYVHGFSEKDIDHMEGKFIHARVFELIRKFSFSCITPEGIWVVAYSGNEMFFKWAKPLDKYPNIDAILNPTVESVDEIAINPDFITKAARILFPKGSLKHTRVLFHGKTKMMKLYREIDGEENWEKNFVGIMPVMINR